MQLTVGEPALEMASMVLVEASVYSRNGNVGVIVPDLSVYPGTDGNAAGVPGEVVGV